MSLAPPPPNRRDPSVRVPRESPRPARPDPTPRSNVRVRAAAASKVPAASRPARAPSVPLAARVAVARERAKALAARLHRPALLLGRGLVVLACVAGALALARLVERHVRTSPAFATHTLAVNGNHRLTRESVLTAAGLSIGQNVFETSPEEVEARLHDHPWIDRAEVERRLPGTYVITVHERTPTALLALDGLYLIADDGTVFARVSEGDPVDLPVITGIDREQFTTDRSFRASLLLEIVGLLHDYRGAGLWRREPIAEVHVESDESLSLYIGDPTAGAPTLVRLGRGPFRPKLRRLRQVVDELGRRETRAAYVYLDNVRRPDRVTVRVQ